MLDNNGQPITRLLTDPAFEARLKTFDPNLELVFDQTRERWMVLEKALDGSGTYNIIIIAEDKDKQPKPLGEWVFNTLYVYRQRYDEKVRVGVDNWLNGLADEAKRQKAEMEEKASQDNVDRIKDDITSWRKASKEIQGLPVSDVTAGYRKIN